MIQQGYDFEKVLEKVSGIFNLEKVYIIGKGREHDRVRARDLLCYWAARELEIPMTEIARKLGMTLAAISYSAKRGEALSKDNDFSLEG